MTEREEIKRRVRSLTGKNGSLPSVEPYAAPVEPYAAPVEPAEQDSVEELLEAPAEAHSTALARRPNGTFQRGVSGNPGGKSKSNPLSVLGWAKELLRHDPARAKRIADNWLTKMELDPNQEGIEKLFDRQDGKVSQPIDHTHTMPHLTVRDRTKVDPRLPPSLADREEDAEETEFEVKE